MRKKAGKDMQDCATDIERFEAFDAGALAF